MTAIRFGIIGAGNIGVGTARGDAFVSVLGHLDEALGAELKALADKADLSSFSIDQVRCLAENNLVLAEAELSMKFKDGNSKNMTGTYLIIRQNEQWLTAAKLPSWFPRIGTEIR